MLALLFFLAFLRNETDEFVRNAAQWAWPAPVA